MAPELRWRGNEDCGRLRSWNVAFAMLLIKSGSVRATCQILGMWTIILLYGSGVGMKRSTKASLLNFILPGAGLWYCHLRRLAIANLLFAVVVPVVAFSTGFLTEHVHWIILAIAAGSAGLV